MNVFEQPTETTPLPRLPRETRRTGLAVHVTLTGHRPLLECEVVTRLIFHLTAEDGATLACCLLPRHLEWLLATGEALTARVHRLRSTSAHAARRLALEGPLWETTFEARVLRPGELEAAARNIVEEPVRAGLVEAVAEWPWQMRRF